MRNLTLITIVLGCAATASAQTAKQLYNNNCISCHQADGSGGAAGTSTLLDDEWATDGSYRAQFKAIKEGMPDFGMPEYGSVMSDPEIWAVVNYIQELRNHHKFHNTQYGPRQRGQDGYQTDRVTYRVETLLDHTTRIPWSVAFLPDGRMIVADRPGEVRLWKDGKLSQPIRGTPEVKHVGQGGMLDVEPHPDYAENGWVYMS